MRTWFKWTGCSVLVYASGIFAIATPLPFLYLFLTGNRRFVLGAVAVGALILGTGYTLLPHLLGQGGVYGLLNYGAYAAIGVLLGVAHHHSWSIPKLFFYYGVLFIIAWVGFAVLVEFLEGRSLMSVIREQIQATLTQVIDLQKNNDRADLDLLVARKDAIAGWMTRLTPGAAFAWSWLVCLANLALAKKWFARLALYPTLKPFAQWRLPFYSVWITIAAILVWVMHAVLVPVGFLMDISANLLLILAALYVLQGVAVTHFFMQKWALGPFARLGIYSAVLLFFQVLGFVLLSLGFFDMWLDSRRLDSPRQTSGLKEK